MNVRRAIATSIVVLGIGGVGASSAQAYANNTTWTARDFAPNEWTGGGSYGNMTRAEGNAPSNHPIKVGARTPNGLLYGSWAGGSSGYVCKNYAANTLQPLVWNIYSSTFKIYGHVGTGAGQSC